MPYATQGRIPTPGNRAQAKNGRHLPCCVQGVTVPEPSFCTLLYRYFFFDWLFKDARRGDMFQRAAAWRHNHEQARWLPLYMWRWLCLGLVMYGLGNYAEVLLGLPELSSFFYVPASLSVPVNAVIAAAWIFLKALPRPL
jgi:drug/metabolite transporter (DMT)-like permease